MKEQSIDDEMIARYLLNELPDDEQRLLEEQLFADDQLFEQTRAVEEDLILDYVRGELSDRERKQFEAHYLATPERRERIELASELTEVLAAEREVTPPESLRSARQEIGWWESLVASLRGQKLAGGFALATLVLLAVGSWFFLQTRQLRGNIERISSERAALEQRERELTQQLGQQRGNSDELSRELDRVRSELDQLESRKATEEELVKAVAALTLTSRLARDPNEAPTVSLRPNADVVQLRINLEADEYKSYRATLRTVADNNEEWRQPGLRTTSTKSGISVMVRIPATIFRARDLKDYILVLTGVTPEGREEEVDQYYFHVIRK